MGFFNPFVGNGNGGGSGGSGKDGVGIQSIEFLSSTGGETSGIEGATDTYQINYTNGTTTTFIVKNGNKGSQGLQGEDGEQGVSISNILVNDNGNLIITLSNGTIIDAGMVKGADGTSINIIDNLSSSDDLPDSDQTIGDSYLIQGDLWVYTNSDDPGAINGFINAGNIQGPAGVGIATILINEDDELVIVYTNDEIVNLGSVKGPVGENGTNGKSAYEIALENDFIGTEAEWIASLKGNKGDKGEDGYTPVKGTDYLTPADIESLGIANKVDKVEGKSLISDTEIERLSSVTNYDDSSKFDENILKPTSLPQIGGNSLPPYFISNCPLSTTIKYPTQLENTTLACVRTGFAEDTIYSPFEQVYSIPAQTESLYTFSVFLYTEDNTSIDSEGVFIQLKGKYDLSTDTGDIVKKYISAENLPNNKWTKFSVTLKITEPTPTLQATINVTRNANIFIAQYKVEDGEVSTGYSPPVRLADDFNSGLMSKSQYTELNKILYHIMKYSFIATNGDKLDPDTANSTVDFVAGENINLTVGYNDTLQADTITISADTSDKADKSYVDGLIGDINTILASVVGGGS